MDWDLQARFEHLSDEVITGPDYLTAVLDILDVLAGEKQASEMRRLVRRALFEGGRKSEESISQFALRRDQDFSMAEKYLQIPDNLKGIMLEEHANLSKQAMLNLRTLTGGSNDYRMVSQALKVLDLEEESLSHKGKSTNFPAFEDSNAAETTEDDEVSSLATQDQEDILVEIEKMDLDEKVAVEVFVALEKEKRSWKENKKLKLAQRKDRRHFADRSSRPYGAPRQKGRRSMNVEAIKKVSRCSNCGERGHWAEDCKKPYRSKADRLEQEKQAKGGNNRNSPSAFVFLGASSSSSAASTHPNLGAFNYFIEEDHISDYDQDTTIPQTLEEHYVLQKDNVEKKENAGAQSALGVFAGMAIPEFAQQVLDRFRSSPSALSQVFIALPAGHAIVDPGAGQDLIGMPAYNKLRKKLASCGLQPIQLEEEPGAASGVGGKAKTLFLALIPCVLGGAPGIVKITVVQQDIPHLLSIGLLESLGSVIDIKGNVLKYENYDSEDPMHRMSSGHRTIDVTKWEGGEFPVPQQVRDQYGLQSGAFNLDDSFASEAYMELPHAAVGRRGLEVESIVTHVHNQPRRGFYTPSSEDCNNLEDIRITLRQHEDGSLSHEVDSWRLPGDIKVEELLVDRHHRVCEEVHNTFTSESFVLKIRSGPFSSQLRHRRIFGCRESPCRHGLAWRALCWTRSSAASRTRSRTRDPAHTLRIVWCRGAINTANGTGAYDARPSWPIGRSQRRWKARRRTSRARRSCMWRPRTLPRSRRSRRPRPRRHRVPKGIWHRRSCRTLCRSRIISC